MSHPLQPCDVPVDAESKLRQRARHEDRKEVLAGVIGCMNVANDPKRLAFKP